MTLAAFVAWAALNSLAVGASVLTFLYSSSIWPFAFSWLVVAVSFNRACAARNAWEQS